MSCITVKLEKELSIYIHVQLFVYNMQMTLFCYQKIQTISNIYSILFEDTIWTGILRSTVKKKVVIFGRGKKDCSISLEGS